MASDESRCKNASDFEPFAYGGYPKVYEVPHSYEVLCHSCGRDAFDQDKEVHVQVLYEGTIYCDQCEREIWADEALSLAFPEAAYE